MRGHLAASLRGAAVAALLAMPLAGQAQGQAYPSKNVSFVVPFAPGGSIDLVARTIAAKLTESMGQPVIVENHPGAGGEVGVGAVVKSRPDGYTLLMSPSGPITAGPHFRKQPFDVTKDLVPVAMLAVIPTVFAVNAQLPVRSLTEFIAYARQRPGQINYGNPGLGSGNHLAAEMLQHMGDFRMVGVPYKGAVASATAVASGEVHAGSGDLTSFIPFVQAGKVRILAAYGPTRMMTAPEIPTVAEAGVANYRSLSWAGLFAPAKTPPQVIARLNEEAMRALQRPEVREAFLKGGLEPAAPMTADRFGQLVRDEVERTGKLIKAANIKAD
jgi:tripartite-type tricarboxylate transporter receptor subunit TctC